LAATFISDETEAGSLKQNLMGIGGLRTHIRSVPAVVSQIYLIIADRRQFEQDWSQSSSRVQAPASWKMHLWNARSDKRGGANAMGHSSK
jgi:hypothetical protein